MAFLLSRIENVRFRISEGRGNGGRKMKKVSCRFLSWESDWKMQFARASGYLGGIRLAIALILYRKRRGEDISEGEFCFRPNPAVRSLGEILAMSRTQLICSVSFWARATRLRMSGKPRTTKVRIDLQHCS